MNSKRWTPLLILVLALGACATQFSVPPVTGSANGEHLPGKIIWHDLLTDTPVRTQVFYSELFGWEFRALPDKNINYMMIYHNGEMIGGMVDQNRLPNKEDISQWVVGLSVLDIEKAADVVREAGGTVFTPPTSLGDRGHIAVVADPQGALLSLLQTRDGDPLDKQGPPAVGSFLWNELWAEDVASSATFYHRLSGYTIEEETLGSEDSPVDYRILKTLDKPRAGIRSNPVGGLQPMWVSYLRVAGTNELEAILNNVEALGGQVLVPATERPGGGVVAIIAGPSGASIALQTWDDDQTIGKLLEERQ
ncbi:MAG: VOC family protein [Proteobacteria bacterium]|nr:VOC family protein [Pseudomonadota bacterium]